MLGLTGIVALGGVLKSGPLGFAISVETAMPWLWAHAVLGCRPPHRRRAPRGLGVASDHGSAYNGRVSRRQVCAWVAILVVAVVTVLLLLHNNNNSSAAVVLLHFF